MTLDGVTLDGPLLAFGGCYSNLQATRALLAEARGLGIAPRRMVCTGDSIAYGADAAATLRLLRDAGVPGIAGNCEESLRNGAADCGCGFAPDSACAEFSTHWYAHAASQMSDADRRYMAGLPRQMALDLQGKKLLVVHGNVERLNAFVFPSASNLELARQLGLAAADIVIAGHCGLPFTRRVGGKIWHNPGSIGLPANDGTPRGWFSLIEARDGDIIITPRALHYDFAAAAAAMRRAGLPEAYASALETGRWPSLDILPAAERQFTGVRLEARHIAEPAPLQRLETLQTLWVNTGTLCNLACTQCFMESTPGNDSLAYFPLAAFHDILAAAPPELAEIGFTGGEPFMNPDIMPMLQAALAAGRRVLVLTNAMRPMQRHGAALARLIAAYPRRLAIRVSLDHYLADRHEALRGKASFAPTLAGLKLLAGAGAQLTIAARTPWGETEAMTRAGFADLFADLFTGLFPSHAPPLDAANPDHLLLFPEIDAASPAAPVTAAALANAAPPMCATARMVVHRKGETGHRIAPCTLLPDRALAAWDEPVRLDHPHCAQFCVHGGASCAG